MPQHDPVNHPSHYTDSPAKCKCGEPIECIQITEHMNFCIGNAVKYIWRSGKKGSQIEDLKKAVWYIQREIGRLEGSEESFPSDEGVTVTLVPMPIVFPAGSWEWAREKAVAGEGVYHPEDRGYGTGVKSVYVQEKQGGWHSVMVYSGNKKNSTRIIRYQDCPLNKAEDGVYRNGWCLASRLTNGQYV
jgi:hypothetical protein